MSATLLLLSVAATFVLIATIAPMLDALTDRQTSDPAQVSEDWRGNSASIRQAGS